MQLLTVGALIFSQIYSAEPYNHPKRREPCATIEAFNNFDVARFSGLWYEIFANPFQLTLQGTCVTYTFGVNAKQTFQVYVKYTGSDQQVRRMFGVGQVTTSNATFVFKFPVTCKRRAIHIQPFTILSYSN